MKDISPSIEINSTLSVAGATINEYCVVSLLSAGAALYLNDTDFDLIAKFSSGSSLVCDGGRIISSDLQSFILASNCTRDHISLSTAQF
jgi:hypothetical protein